MVPIGHNHIHLTSAEMACLWTSYINNTMSKCVLQHFLRHMEDEEIQNLVQETYDIACQAITDITSIMEGVSFPLPVGFTDQDVQPDAPRAFEDTFYLMYIRQMAKMGLLSYAGFLSLIARSDVLNLFKTSLKMSIRLYERATKIALYKGVHVRAPYLKIPDRVDFVSNNNYLGGGLILLSKEKRPLNAIEISHLHTNMETNLLGSMVCTAFAQMAHRQDVKSFMVRGKELAQKNLKIFGKTLVDSELQAPMSWDTSVTDTTTPVFSDKLMMFHITFLSAAGISNYATASAASARADVAAEYVKLSAEIAAYAKDGADILIKYGWMEEPPQAADRRKLIGKI